MTDLPINALRIAYDTLIAAAKEIEEMTPDRPEEIQPIFKMLAKSKREAAVELKAWLPEIDHQPFETDEERQERLAQLKADSDKVIIEVDLSGAEISMLRSLRHLRYDP